MKVYCFSYIGGYGGGCAIIVANSALEAYGVLCKEHQYYADCFNIKPEIISDLIPSEIIKEPKIILYKIYIE